MVIYTSFPNKKALEKGVPYQSLVSRMIHQYVEGDLVERCNIVIIDKEYLTE